MLVPIIQGLRALRSTLTKPISATVWMVEWKGQVVIAVKKRGKQKWASWNQTILCPQKSTTLSFGLLGWMHPAHMTHHWVCTQTNCPPIQTVDPISAP